VDKINKYQNKPVIYMWKHKKISWFKYVGQTKNVFERCVDHIQNSTTLFGYALMITKPEDWTITILTEVEESKDYKILNLHESLSMYENNTIFPHGLNLKMEI